jgi:hypothetical protein
MRRRETVRQVTEQLGSSVSQPASEVFANVQTPMFKAFPAGRLLAMMDQGYGRALGVTCAKCHIPGRWESDSLPAKRIAREMQTMVFAINADLLRKTGVRPEAVVNCTTCHRGATKPVTNLDLPRRTGDRPQER